MSFFRTTIYLSLGLILFSLGVSFVGELDVFPTTFQGAGTITGISPDMDWVWGSFVSFGTLLTLGLCYITRSVNPLGVYIYGVVFWSAWIHASALLSSGGFIPLSFIAMGTIGVAFLFTASIIGMFTGSG